MKSNPVILADLSSLLSKRWIHSTAYNPIFHGIIERFNRQQKADC